MTATAGSSGWSAAARAFSRIPAPDLLGAALAGVGLFARVLASGDDFLGSGTDLVTMEAPMAAFATRWLRRGVLPLWQPFICGGVPFPAATKGYFSPPFWLGLVLSDAAAIKVDCAVSLAIAGAGGAWFCRPHVRSRLASALGGALFATSGFFAAHLFAGHLELVAAAAFMPWMVGIVDRSRREQRIAWGPAAACFGLALLAAHYPMVAIGCLGAALFVVATALLGGARVGLTREHVRHATRALATLGVLLVGGAVIAAVQVLPLAETLPFTQRQASGASFASSFPAVPATFLGMLLPSLLGPRTSVAFVGEFAPWEAYGYVGLVTLVLAAFGMASLPRARWAPAAATASVGALLALGDRTPALRILCAVLPPLQRFRAPGRYLIVVALFAALLAALGLDALVSPTETPPRRRSLVAPAALAGAALLVAAALTELPEAWITRGVATLAPFDPSASAAKWTSLVETLRNDATLAVLVLGAAVGALAWSVTGTGRGARATMMLGALAVFDTIRVAQPMLRTAPHKTLDWVAPLVDHLRDAVGPGGRMLPTPDLASPNVGAPYDLASPTGYSIFLDDRFARYFKRAAGLPLDSFVTVVQSDVSEPLMRHLGVGLVLTGLPLAGADRTAHLGIGDAHLIGGMGRVQVLAVNAPVPRATLVHAVEQVRGELDTYARMEDPSFDIRKTVLVETDPSLFPVQPASASAREGVTIATYEPNVVTMRVDASSPGVAVLSDVYEEGWTAQVDGSPALLAPANRVMRAVPVTAGHHELVMRYRPPGLTAGAWLSGLGVVVALGLALAGRTRRAQGSTTSAPNASGT